MGLGPVRSDQMMPGCYNSTERLKDMDLDGVHTGMCFPSFPRSPEHFSWKAMTATWHCDVSRPTTISTSTNGRRRTPTGFRRSSFCRSGTSNCASLNCDALWPRAPRCQLHRKPDTAGTSVVPYQLLGPAVQSGRRCRHPIHDAHRHIGHQPDDGAGCAGGDILRADRTELNAGDDQSVLLPRVSPPPEAQDRARRGWHRVVAVDARTGRHHMGAATVLAEHQPGSQALGAVSPQHLVLLHHRSRRHRLATTSAWIEFCGNATSHTRIRCGRTAERCSPRPFATSPTTKCT